MPWCENGAILNEVNFAPLFGGAEISRAHLPVFLRAFIDGDGRIPVERLAGSQADRRAAARQEALCAQGLRCFRTSGSETLDARGAPVRMSLQGVDARVQALLCRRDVDALVVVER